MLTLSLALVLSALGLVSACGRANVVDQPSPAGWPGGRTFLSTSVTDGGVDRPVVAGTRIIISFIEADKIGVVTGCNHIGGTGRVDGGRLVADLEFMTELACDEPRSSQETFVMSFLSASPTYRLAGNELTLTSGEVQIRLLDRRAEDPDRPLVGTHWVVAGMTGHGVTVTPDTTVSPTTPPGPPAYLVFDGQGGFAGSTGCSAIDGSAVISGDRITITAAVPGPPSCTGEALALHNGVVATLRGDVGYHIEGGRLTLSGPNGAGLALLAQT